MLSGEDVDQDWQSAQGLDLKTILAGRIARAAAVFQVDEIVVFNEAVRENEDVQQQRQQHDPSAFLELLLSYAECPPYLRKRLFGWHADLGKSGLLAPLDIPHHLKTQEWCVYREGVAVGLLTSSSPSTISSSPQTQNRRQKQKQSPIGTLIDAGFPVAIADQVPAGTRLTVKLASESEPLNFQDNITGTWEIDETTEPMYDAIAVDPNEPRDKAGYYWGFNVRLADSLSAVFTHSLFEDGYDLCIGTSERGEPLNTEVLPAKAKHLLVVFGGVAGLEAAVDADDHLRTKGIRTTNIADLFDSYINVLPRQGSRTMRTEEAIWITLSRLSDWVDRIVR